MQRKNPHWLDTLYGKLFAFLGPGRYNGTQNETVI